MAEGPEPGNAPPIRRQVERSPQDRCVGSLPFDYSILEDSGRASDAGSNVPEENLISRSSFKQEPEPSPEVPVPHAETETTKQTPKRNGFNDDRLPLECKGLLNRKAVRLTALKLINERFPQGDKKFTRVSDKFIDALENAVRSELLYALERHPSPLLLTTVKEF
jgi:hypothetical protein